MVFIGLCLQVLVDNPLASGRKTRQVAAATARQETDSAAIAQQSPWQSVRCSELRAATSSPQQMERRMEGAWRERQRRQVDLPPPNPPRAKVWLVLFYYPTLA